jgi:hypothetical protein
MTYEDVINLVENSRKDDWLYNDHRSVFIFKPNVCIRIEFNSAEGYIVNYEWAINHPNSQAKKVFYSIYYNATLIKEFILVSVDGGKAMLPIPQIGGTSVISKSDYEYAKIVDDTNKLDEYIERSKLTIQSDN